MVLVGTRLGQDEFCTLSSFKSRDLLEVCLVNLGKGLLFIFPGGFCMQMQLESRALFYSHETNNFVNSPLLENGWWIFP